MELVQRFTFDANAQRVLSFILRGEERRVVGDEVVEFRGLIQLQRIALMLAGSSPSSLYEIEISVHVLDNFPKPETVVVSANNLARIMLRQQRTDECEALLYIDFSDDCWNIQANWPAMLLESWEVDELTRVGIELVEDIWRNLIDEWQAREAEPTEPAQGDEVTPVEAKERARRWVDAVDEKMTKYQWGQEERAELHIVTLAVLESLKDKLEIELDDSEPRTQADRAVYWLCYEHDQKYMYSEEATQRKVAERHGTSRETLQRGKPIVEGLRKLTQD